MTSETFDNAVLATGMARDEFRVFATRRYIDVASRAPMADRVAHAVEDYLDVCRSRGADKEEWLQRAEDIRGRLADLLGAAPDEVAFTKNTSDGLNTVATALGLGEGDNVIVAPDLEHANNVYPWLNLRRRGIEIRMLPLRDGTFDLDALTAAIDASTKVVTLSALSSMTGARPDLDAIAGICRPRGIFTLVDAAQSAGILDVDLSFTGIDALAAATQKGLLSMYGLGFLYCRADWAQRLDPPFLSVPSVARAGLHESDLGEYTFEIAPDARRFETGNYNFAGLFALEAALTFYDEFPLSTVDAHVTRLGTRLIEGLLELGCEVVTPADPARRAGIVVFTTPDVHHTLAVLEQRHVRICIRRGRLRASFHLYNTAEDVDVLLAGVAASLRP